MLCLEIGQIFVINQIYPFQDDKILALCKIARIHRTEISQNIRPIFHTVKNIVEKGENAGYYHLLFPQYFQKAFSSLVPKVVMVWLKVLRTEWVLFSQ